MRQDFISHRGTKSLVLFFTGWGMESSRFDNISTPCDFMIVYDYNDFNFDITTLYDYKNIYLFAWSFGVFAASNFLNEHTGLPIVFKMAVNGTQFPIDDNKGIPEKIFNATTSSLSERSLLKFYRRMCNGIEQYERFISHHSERTLDSLKQELNSVHDKYFSTSHTLHTWDKVLISKNDLIFPFENQLNGWVDLCGNIDIDDESHMPSDFEILINNNIINKDLVKQRFSKSLNSSYDANASIQKIIAQKLFSTWKSTLGLKQDCSILEIGCGTGFLTRLYTNEIYPSRLVLNDLCNTPTLTLNLNTTNYEFIEADAERLDFNDGEFDYIVSSSAIQWFENLPQFFTKANRWLKCGGSLILSTFSPQNLEEIKETIKISLNYKETNWLYTEINRNFDIVFIESERMTMYFDSPLDVLRHMRSTGVNSINSSKTARGAIKKLLNSYQAEENGKFPLSYCPIYLIATKNNG